MKRIIMISAAVLASAAVSGCAAMKPERDAIASVSTAGMPGALEPIHAAAFTRDQAVFWVSSNGCTKKDDLRPMVSPQGDASVITLRRISEDRCNKPQNDGVEVRWSFEELGVKPGTPLSVNNPYQLPPT